MKKSTYDIGLKEGTPLRTCSMQDLMEPISDCALILCASQIPISNSNTLSISVSKILEITKMQTLPDIALVSVNGSSITSSID